MWEIYFFLPDLRIEKDIVLDHIGLVSSKNEIITDLCKKSKITDRVANNFFDQFQRQKSPSFLIINLHSPDKIKTLEAIVDFRNIYAISAIIKGQENAFRYENLYNPIFSDFFNFYPITITKDNRSLLISSPATLGVDKPECFCGQTNPGIPDHLTAEPDEIIFEELLKYWERKYLNGKHIKWKIKALFRSLEMAFHASAMPYKNHSTIFDYGTSISLWVSSFEILTHNFRENLNLWTVIDCLESYSWSNKDISRRLYKLDYHDRVNRCNRDERISIVSRLYKDIYFARNDFLHGNKLKKGNIYPFRNNKINPLNYFAALIYKVALISKLDIFKDKRKNKSISLLCQKKINDDYLSEVILKAKHINNND